MKDQLAQSSPKRPPPMKSSSSSAAGGGATFLGASGLPAGLSAGLSAGLLSFLPAGAEPEATGAEGFPILAVP